MNMPDVFSTASGNSWGHIAGMTLDTTRKLKVFLWGKTTAFGFPVKRLSRMVICRMCLVL